jgi:hypothetical protein
LGALEKCAINISKKNKVERNIPRATKMEYQYKTQKKNKKSLAGREANNKASFDFFLLNICMQWGFVLVLSF